MSYTVNRWRPALDDIASPAAIKVDIMSLAILLKYLKVKKSFCCAADRNRDFMQPIYCDLKSRRGEINVLY